MSYTPENAKMFCTTSERFEKLTNFEKIRNISRNDFTFYEIKLWKDL